MHADDAQCCSFGIGKFRINQQRKQNKTKNNSLIISAVGQNTIVSFRLFFPFSLFPASNLKPALCKKKPLNMKIKN